MTTYHTALLLGFAIGLAALIPLTLALRGRHKAAGYACGHAAGRSEQCAKIQLLQDEVARHKHVREIERQGHQQRTEAVMQDCDERIAIYARRANPFTERDQTQLLAIAGKLALAADTFAGLTVGDHAQAAKRLSAHADQMARRLSEALLAAEVAVIVEEAA